LNFQNLLKLKMPSKVKNIHEINMLIKNALFEDIGTGDITADALIPKNQLAAATLITKENNVVLCGLGILKETFKAIDKKIKVTAYARDGQSLKKQTIVAKITGPARSMLMAERTALNFLGRLSGIATQTRTITSLIKGSRVKVLDSRKTTPGLRILEKYAVRMGGGYNHRFGLFDQVLIKDNHISMFKKKSPGSSLGAIIEKTRKSLKEKVLIEIEVNDFKELSSALRAFPDIIMLDNMSLSVMRKSVMLRNKLMPKVKLEASGNINESNILQVAKVGVDFISIGALTHSVKNADFSINFI